MTGEDNPPPRHSGFGGGIPQRVRLGFCLLVATIWAASFVASLINPNYQPDPSINAVFTLVIGAVLTRWSPGGRDHE